jgi:predicted nucleic acid-binding protein
VDELGHEQMRGLHGPLVVSALARVEVTAGIWRKHRSGELDLDDSLLLIRAFTADHAGAQGRSQRFLTVAVGGGIIERAADLAGAHGLRAYDAVQLASALAARELDKRCITLASFDRELNRAALSEGFETLPSAETPETARAHPPERH